MTPKDWNTQEEVIAAAKAEILAAISGTDARLELGMVKSIQRGYIHMNNAATKRVSISEVNIDKAIILITGNGLAGSYNSTIYVTDFSTDSFVAVLVQAGATTPTIAFSWQVIEFY